MLIKKLFFLKLSAFSQVHTYTYTILLISRVAIFIKTG